MTSCPVGWSAAVCAICCWNGRSMMSISPVPAIRPLLPSAGPGKSAVVGSGWIKNVARAEPCSQPGSPSISPLCAPRPSSPIKLCAISPSTPWRFLYSNRSALSRFLTPSMVFSTWLNEGWSLVQHVASAMIRCGCSRGSGMR